ncbi:type I glyceraldehyde-3-phosphate dehydrogenase [Bombilactobacillus folatiphilus]|uniref:Glyceraldehyde-3-phosphate dehydrogenase n=1 Tax=Bombilactobacillus folatiphilus TaxID=2923362 RepID=A0ABY4PB22_9LACO|nr:type I glyceraldehyde-3-phosphate dehydrogenase [Bombilactobacillus folatiphilus]UQS82825.1 type I glyceraldehyde-3-phosphate dehydrogenase [Bombilactobacillus folatiphilus]
MVTKLGINGFGRIGRLALRRIITTSNDLEVVAINDLTSPKVLAHLLKYDTGQGTLDGEITATENAIVVNGHEIPVYSQSDASQIPWVNNDGVELVLESSGFYTSQEKAQAHLRAGVKRVLISAPAGEMKTIVYGVNDDILTRQDQIVSAGSCTTNCLAPLAQAMNDSFGIKVGSMTTIHAYTNSQSLQDSPKSNLRAARAAAMNTVPLSTGAAKAIGLVIPELKGKLNGHAQRVPVIAGSVVELDTVLNQRVTAEQVNQTVSSLANNDSFTTVTDEIVSSDVIGSTYGSIFDPTQTQVVDGGDLQMVKTVAWYDNEYGFTSQMIRTLDKFAHF